MKLSERARKVFVEFQLASREPVVEGAKRLRLKTHIVHAELKRLIDGKIAYPYMLTNPASMGLLDVEVLCSLGSEMQRSIDQLIHTLKKLPGIFTLNVTGGDSPVAFGLQVRHPNDVSLVLDSLCSRAGLTFERRSVAIRTDLRLFFRKYMSSHEPKQKSFCISSTNETVELDQTDRSILAAFNAAPLASFRDIARTTKVPESTVVYRFNALCAAGVIVGFGLSIDGTDIGMHTFRIVIRAANPTLALRDSVYAFAARHPHVLSCSSFIGDWDYFLRVEVESPLDVFSITQDLARTVSPHRIEMAVVPVLREIHFRRKSA